ncbi:MAG: phosphopantothenoylcysteine decarboxylase [Phycisphaerales bacterium]|nr:phosphopantothenoylcysteine decarboxylase [Phycisphaerales bacterium]
MTDRTQRILITAGPTHEPIDAVRYIGNRSSGRLGHALAVEAARRGHHVTLLLGPTCLTPLSTDFRTEQFRTTADLADLLDRHWPDHDGLIMAAAVADYRPVTAKPATKLRRSGGLTLKLEPTEDLLAKAAGSRRSDQWIIGFALEPEDRLESSAREKLARKRIDAIVANPLQTMDADSITASVYFSDGASLATPPEIDKADFAKWLCDKVLPKF